jgi:hypothetical protein
MSMHPWTISPNTTTARIDSRHKTKKQIDNSIAALHVRNPSAYLEGPDPHATWLDAS